MFRLLLGIRKNESLTILCTMYVLFIHYTIRQLCLLGSLCYIFFARLILFILNPQLCFIVASAGEYCYVFPSTIHDVSHFHCYFMRSLHFQSFRRFCSFPPPSIPAFSSYPTFSSYQPSTPSLASPEPSAAVHLLGFYHLYTQLTLRQHSCRHYGLLFGFQSNFFVLVCLLFDHNSAATNSISNRSTSICHCENIKKTFLFCRWIHSHWRLQTTKLNQKPINTI